MKNLQLSVNWINCKKGEEEKLINEATKEFESIYSDLQKCLKGNSEEYNLDEYFLECSLEHDKEGNIYIKLLIDTGNPHHEIRYFLNYSSKYYEFTTVELVSLPWFMGIGLNVDQDLDYVFERVYNYFIELIDIDSEIEKINEKIEEEKEEEREKEMNSIFSICEDIQETLQEIVTIDYSELNDNDIEDIKSDIIEVSKLVNQVYDSYC